MSFSRVFESLFLALLLLGGGILTQVGCFSFNFSNFPDQNPVDFLMPSAISHIEGAAIQVTPNVNTESYNINRSGRAFYKNEFRLWSKSKDVAASFNTTFVFTITPHTNSGGEGLAFILAADDTLPQSSDGQWLGIVNAATNGSSQANVVAVEFDTRKSYPEDLDGDHVGLDVNSINSIKQVSLGGYGVNISAGNPTSVRVVYDGKNNTVSVLMMTNGTGEYMPVMSLPLNLSDHLPEKVFVGFSASTSNYTQQNSINSWAFDGDDIGEDAARAGLLWVWITVPVVVIVLISGVVFYMYWERKHRERPEDAYPMIEDQIRGSSMAPLNFKLRELRKATGNFNPRNKLGKGGFGTHNDYNNGIVYWLWALRREDRILDAVDSKLSGQFDEDEMAGTLVLGLACCHPNPHQRPSMRTVLQVLTGEAPPPLLPAERPDFVWPAMPPSFKEDTDNGFIKSQLTPFTELAGR
ncbi:hypothetical protein FH972_020159 [Carpinus fangiana]|uniref:Legume lectin domain-containing protein n=1 Tax=Carpinus fangiana TaxID=176857 RepID=A0A5N6RUJ2_9ROSI|nr:hypothetical protein FH972_020159 [Carpinus fangiana]